jgi:hypothetical protein
MNHHHIRGLTMFECVLQYFIDHPVSPAIPRVTALATALAAVVATLKEHAADQARGHTRFRGGAADRRQRLTELLGKMRPLNRIARSMDAAEFPAAREHFRMPRSQAYTAIVAQARAFVAHATAMEAAFLERGRPAGFIAQLSALADAVESAVGPRNTGLEIRAGATAGLTGALRRGLAIRRELDAILTSLFEDDATALGAWKTAQHVERAARKRAVEGTASQEVTVSLVSNEAQPIAIVGNQVQGAARGLSEKAGP